MAELLSNSYIDGEGLELVGHVSLTQVPVAIAFKFSVLNTNSPTKTGNDKRLTAMKDIPLGEELFSSESVLLASSEGYGCIACNDTMCMSYCDPFRFYFEPLRAVLQAAPRLSTETNVHVTVVRLMIKYIALKKTENQKLKELLDRIFELDTNKEPFSDRRDEKLAEKLLALLPGTHKTFVTKDRLQNLVRILVTNTIQVPFLKGVGLYPVAPLLDHSCKENCYYECIGQRLAVTSITAIQKDQPLTFNYLKSYLPRAQRQAEIKNLFRHNCSCELCGETVRDETRAFVCKKCTFVSEEECGIVCPKGSGSKISDWTCNKCSESPTNEVFAEYTALEEQTVDLDIVTLKINDLIKKRIFHPYHYIIYRALVQRVKLLLDIRPATCEKYLTWILAANARVLHPNHPERAKFFDQLSDARRLTADLKGCREANAEFLSIMEKISTKNSPELAIAKQKSVNPEKIEISLWYPIKDL